MGPAAAAPSPGAAANILGEEGWQTRVPNQTTDRPRSHTSRRMPKAEHSSSPCPAPATSPAWCWPTPIHKFGNNSCFSTG